MQMNPYFHEIFCKNSWNRRALHKLLFPPRSSRFPPMMEWKFSAFWPLSYKSKVADWDYSFQIRIYLLLISQNRNRVVFFINRIGVHFTLLMLQLSFCLRGGPTAQQSKTKKLNCLAYFLHFCKLCKTWDKLEN